MSKIINAFKHGGLSWPYRTQPEDAFKKVLAVAGGIFVGAKLVNMYSKPLDPFYEELEQGKIDLYRRYKKRFENLKAGRPADFDTTTTSKD